MTQYRGQLTERIKAKSMELLGYEMDVVELRLMPYIIYVMTNEQRIDPNRVNAAERDILKKWRDLKFIEGGASGLSISRKFYDILNEIIFLGYVDIVHEDVINT